MYQAEELKELSEKPRINDISLDILRQYYAQYLMPFIYSYKLNDGINETEFKLIFDDIRFCHLLGVESIAKGHVKFKDLSEYRGKKGWINVESKKIDFKHLKRINKNKFQSVKAKFVYFYLIPDLLEHPLAVKFDGNKITPPVKIQSELLFYSSYENAVIHLGIDKNREEDFYYPRTFFVEKLGKDKVEDIYTVNQEPITVTKQNRIILL